MADWEELLRGLARRVRILEVRNPLENAAIDRGGLYVLSNEGLVVEGSAKVSGYLVVTGTLKGTGTFDWSGVMNISGQQNVTGPTTFTGQMTVNGPWKFVGAGEITGNVEVTGNIKVLPGGKIQVGNIVIDPTISGGAVTFANGAQVFTDGTTIQVYKGNSVVQIANDYARLQNGGNAISIGSSGAQISVAAVAPISGTGAKAGALFQDSNGNLRRSDGT